MEGTAQIKGSHGHTANRVRRARRLPGVSTAGDPRLIHTAAAVPERLGAGGGPRDLAGFEGALAGLSLAVDDAAAGHEDWLCRVRAGVVALLGFFDDEPACGRLLLEGLGGDDQVLALRCEQRVLGVLTALLEGGREPSANPDVCASWSLIDELAAGGAYAVLRTRVREGDRAPLVELAPDLLAFITLPYLGQGGVEGQSLGAPVPSLGPLAPHRALPIRVTHRTTVVLGAIAGQPGANNREIAVVAGPINEGQLSKLLSRLAERNLIENLAHRSLGNEPNAWRLTAEGERTLRRIDAAPAHPPRRTRRSRP